MPPLLLALVVLDGLGLLLALALLDPRRPGIARPWRSCTVPVEARSPAGTARGPPGPCPASWGPSWWRGPTTATALRGPRPGRAFEGAAWSRYVHCAPREHLRRAAEGRRKKTSPYQRLSVPLPPDLSWWQLLQLTPGRGSRRSRPA